MTSKKQDIPEAKVLEENVDGSKILAGLGYEVCSFRHGPAGSNVPVSEVHLLIPLPIEGARVALRLKSKRALDELVGVLLDYRNQVWPEGKA